MLTTPIADLLRTRLPHIPVTEIAATGVPAYIEGVNVTCLVRTDTPSRSYPYRGVLVHVMYVPQAGSESLCTGWYDEVKAVLLATFPDRYRPTPDFGEQLSVLIEDVGTPYAQWRAAENSKRADLGFAPLHEINK